MSFEVVNGSWNIGSKTPDTEWVSLKEDEVWSKNGSGTFTAPEADNKPAEHYKTGAEAMTMFNRVLQRVPESEADLLPGMKTWPDNADPKKWYYLSVQEATNSHDYERKSNGYEHRTKLREDQ